MEQSELPPETFILSFFFKPPKENFNSRRFISSSASGKPFSVYISHGNCLIEPSKSEGEIPEFTKKFTYPEDASTPENIQQLSKNLIKTAENVNSVKLDKISLTWGIDADSQPFIIDISNSHFTPTNEIQNNFSFQCLLFIALEVAKQTKPNVCITNSKSCIDAYYSIERKKVESHQVSQFVKKLGFENKKECYEYIMKKMNSLCPQMMLSMCPACHNCFKKFSKIVSFPTMERKEKTTSRSTMRTLGSTTLRSTSRPMSGASTAKTLRNDTLRASTTSRLTSRTMNGETKTTSRSVATKRQSNEANDLHDLERLSETTRRSGNSYLKPTQAYSFNTYKQAYKLYHNQVGFSLYRT